MSKAKPATIEVQGTAEAQPFSRAELDSLLSLAEAGITALIGMQRSVVGAYLER